MVVHVLLVGRVKGALLLVYWLFARLRCCKVERDSFRLGVGGFADPEVELDIHTLQHGLLSKVNEVEGDGASNQEGGHRAKEGSRPGTHVE